MIPFDPKIFRWWLRFWSLRQWYHRAELVGAEQIPREGGALVVSNHGRLDFDSLILIKLLLDHCGRCTRSMADRVLFQHRFVARLAHLLGAVEGTRAHAVELLSSGELVLTYPGGVQEILSSRFGQEQLRWAGRLGFARVAIQTQCPIIPIASVGVNHGFFFLTEGRWLGHLLYQRVLRMGPKYAHYRDPLALGILPIPLPYSMAVHWPLPCKVRYVVGRPIYPEMGPEYVEDEDTVQRLAWRVEEAMWDLLAQHGHPDKEAREKAFVKKG